MSVLFGLSFRNPAEPPAETVEGMLRDCHVRIRHFSQMAVRLACATDVDEAARTDAARALERYFTVALPLHSADEDVSLAPRLRAAGIADEVRRALDAMTAEHGDINDAISELLPLWSRLVSSPADWTELATRMAVVAHGLEDVCREHLATEERLIFPEIDRRLPPEEQRAIADEMRARRGR